MTWVPPLASDFKAFFNRDFPYAPADAQADPCFIWDGDINKAFDEALVNFNPGLFKDSPQATTVFMYLAAFYLVEDLKRSSKGVNAAASFPAASKSIGGVSVSYQIPERYTKDPYLAGFMANAYGQKYLSLVLPLLVGNVRTYCEGVSSH